MRARLLLAVAALAVSCSGGKPSPAAPTRIDSGFLAHLPPDAHVVLRLPPAGVLAARAQEFAALAKAWGVAPDFYRGAPAGGVDPARAGGLALTPSGGWTLFLPAADKRALSQALRDQVAAGLAYREEGNWVLLSSGAQPGGLEGEPLLDGDLAIRARHHPLLATFAHGGDSLELGVTCEAGAMLFEGAMHPGGGGATEEALAAAATPRGEGWIEFLPASLALRAETTIPPMFLAEFFASAVAAHCGMKEATDRSILVRFLREGLSAAEPAETFAFGVDVSGGAATILCAGAIAGGPPSPILNRLRKGGREAFGALVLEARRGEENASWIGLSAWIAQASPNLEGLPRCCWETVRALCDDTAGLPLLYGEAQGKFVFAAGPRADRLGFDTLRRLSAGGERTNSSWALFELRREDPTKFVLGCILNGKALAALPDEDRALLRAALGAGPSAPVPTDVVFAGFRDGPQMRIKGRVAY